MADEAKIERVARAMCVARGEDPDKTVAIPGRATGFSFADKQWRKHALKAEIFIAAHEALNAAG
jgi:hypothetical protein